MPSKRQPHHQSSDESSPSSAGAPLSANSISFSHFTDLHSTPSTTSVKKEPKTESEFKVSFQFVGNQDARKATTENRSHVMREYRRKQRWEQDQKKKLEAEKSSSADEKGKGNAASSVVKTEGTDLADTLAIGKLVQTSKRKWDFGDSGREAAMLKDFEHESSNVAMQLMWQMAAPINNTIPSPNAPVLDVFTQRFVDSFAPRSQTAGSAQAIRSIATIKEFSPILTNAFNAVSTTFAGRTMDDPQIILAGHGIYTGVLKSLQEALAHPVYSRSEAVLSTVVLCIAFESMRHTTPEALTKHCQGALQLIEFRGPYAHVDGLEHLCFAEMRPYWAFAAIAFRQPTFLSESRWKTIPWSTKPKDIMSHLLDHVCDVPAALYQFDTIRTMASDATHNPSDIAALQDTLWRSVCSFHNALLSWKAVHADTYPLGHPEPTTTPLGETPFPVLRTRNPRTGAISTPPLIRYPDPELARVLCTYYATMIVLGSVDSRPADGSYGYKIERLQMFSYALTILQSIEYFIRNVPGNMTNRMMYPLTAAYEAMPKDGPEREYIDEVYKVIDTRKASMVMSKVTHNTE